jgi:signal transduction histidine kinase
MSEPQQDSRPGSPASLRLRAERQWSGAIAALHRLLQPIAEHPEHPEHHGSAQTDRHLVGPLHNAQGLIFAGPSPILATPDLMTTFALWTMSVPQSGGFQTVMNLLPAAGTPPTQTVSPQGTLPLTPHDPLAQEQFCLVLTAEFSLVMALGEDAEQQPAFLFSFSPELVWQSWRSLRSRLVQTAPHLLRHLDMLVEKFPPTVPDYRTVSEFTRLMLTYTPEPALPEPLRECSYPGTSAAHGVLNVAAQVSTSRQSQPATKANPIRTEKPDPKSVNAAHQIAAQHNSKPYPEQEVGADVELLRAIAHEVRTPLSTIRTLTRLLLRRKNLSPDIVKRLEAIDRECTEQIDRFNLIFRAVELETASGRPLSVAPGPISLQQVLQEKLPRWQDQASQHNLTLNVTIPSHLPMVLADATMLDQMLTGIIDRITHNLTSGGHIDLQVKAAGHQLKLQFQSYPSASDMTAIAEDCVAVPSTPRTIGDVLIFQPDTGNLSLNLSVTKNLFQALGGKLIVRQRPQQGEELTVFLPLENR